MRHSIVKDILEVSFSNGTVLLSSIFTGFIIPMMLGATNYGYYKIFILYSTYTSLLHFGFVDGVLILDGGKQYKNLDFKQYRTNSQFFILFQFFISLILSFISFFVTGYFYKILFITLGIYTFFINVMTYYQFVSQATLQFKYMSFAQIMESIFNIVLIFSLYCLYSLRIINKPNFLPCISILLLVSMIICIWYIYIYRNITFGLHNELRKTLSSIFKYFKAGIYITISYQVSMLLMNLDNQFVSWFFSAYIYGIYAFAYSLISVIDTILSSISAVLLPHLKRKSKYEMLRMYPTITTYILLIVFFLFIGYFPLEIIIKLFIYKYIGSLIYFRILLPGIAISCCLSLVIFTYFNALNRSKVYFIVSLIVLIISMIFYLTLYLFFKSVIALSFGSLIVLILWAIISEGILIYDYGIKWQKNALYSVIMIILFYICGTISNVVIGALIYFLLYMLLSMLLFKKIMIWNYKYILKNYILNK